MKQYKTFKDLVFKPHPRLHSGLQAKLEFENGYGASVLIGDIFYSDGVSTYEIACMKDGLCVYPKVLLSKMMFLDIVLQKKSLNY